MTSSAGRLIPLPGHTEQNSLKEVPIQSFFFFPGTFKLGVTPNPSIIHSHRLQVPRKPRPVMLQLVQHQLSPLYTAGLERAQSVHKAAQQLLERRCCVRAPHLPPACSTTGWQHAHT